MTTPITKKWLLEHGFVFVKQKGLCHRYEASLPYNVDSITIFLYDGDYSIDFWVEGDDISVRGSMKEGTAEELQRYIDVCNLSDEFLDAYRLNKKGDDDD